MPDMMDKKADLAGPGISTYEEVARILPSDYSPLLNRKDTQKALYDVKRIIEDGLARELNLMMVQVPLIVTVDSGVNDMLDRDGSRTPIEFNAGLGLETPIRASVVQAATKWKRPALKLFDCEVGEGINTDMRAVRKDYFLDHDHSSYVDQWDWEKVITADQRNLEFLKSTVRSIWKVLKEAEEHALTNYPALNDPRYPPLPDELVFLHAEEILDMYPDLPRKQRETRVIQDHAPAIFIIGIGSVLKDGYPHEMRAADYDDWITDTSAETGKDTHGLNGDILVWNPVTMLEQLELSDQMDFLEQPYHQAIMNDEIPLSIGGGIGQSRTYMLLLRKAHLGEVSVTVWPDELKKICAEKNIHVLE
jgi:aspartate--ammonia ligase